MARTAHAATVEPKRPEDRRGYYAASWGRSLGWPSAALGAFFFSIFSAIFVVRGRQAAAQWLEDITAPAFLIGMGTVVIGIVTLVFKVGQIAKAEMHAAAAASNSAGAKQEAVLTREEVKQLVAEVRAAPAASAPREPDPTTGEIAALVKKISGDVSVINERLQRVESGTLAAARASTGAAAAVSGYGESLASIARGVSAVTGQTPAQRPPEPAREPEWLGSRYGRPEARQEPQEDREDWSRREGSHRAETTQQAAVSGADEQEDWQEPADDGDGLDTGYRMGFREQMAAAEARERAAREAAEQTPPPRTPRFPVNRPTVVPAWEPYPAADPAEEQARQQRARRWTNPEEGPQ